MSSRLKVIEKPKNNPEEQLRWKHALYQLGYEKSFMLLQNDMQKAWEVRIKKASNSLIDKIWELDSCFLNKLRLTASADHISLNEYLSELMSKHILGEFEEKGAPQEEISKLESGLEIMKDTFTFSSSVEVTDPYETLKFMLADTVNHRYSSIENFNKLIIDEDKLENEYSNFLNKLKFGSILRNNQGNLLLHLTQPCDYIHVAYNKSDDESLIFFPGVILSLYKEEQEGNKKYITPYIKIEDDISSVKWNLRRPITFSIKELFNISREFDIVGKLRDDYAQAISNRFASGVSRVATMRVPRFEEINVYHVYFDNNFDALMLSCKDEDITISKERMDFDKGMIFKARRYKDQRVQNKNKKYHRVILLGHSSAELTEQLKGPIKNDKNISMELLDGVSFGDAKDSKTEIRQNGIVFSHIEGFKKELGGILKEAQTQFKNNQIIFNLILIQT
jgi:hypothetical protein